MGPALDDTRARAYVEGKEGFKGLCKSPGYIQVLSEHYEELNMY